MTSSNVSKIGTLLWHDLTVPNADEVKDFYQRVVGWESSGQDMGGYEDYNMMPPGSQTPVAGICHARGVNAKIPPQWMIYFCVADAAKSAAECQRLGGEIIDGPRQQGQATFCIIRDPAGAVAALYSE